MTNPEVDLWIQLDGLMFNIGSTPLDEIVEDPERFLEQVGYSEGYAEADDYYND